MLTLKITKIGSSSGLILPKEALARLGVKQGDVIHLTQAPDGGFRLTPFDPVFKEQMEVGERIMRRDRDGLRALAK
jgi:putative addiction module antidote